MGKKSTGSLFGVSLLLGAVIGYALSLFMPEPTRQKHKQLLTDNARQLEKLLTDPKERERVRKLFEKNTQEVTEKYRQSREILVKKLGDLKLAVADIDKDRYQEVVREAIEDIRKEQLIPTKQLAQLREYLEADYHLIKNRAAQPVAKTKKIAKK